MGSCTIEIMTTVHTTKGRRITEHSNVQTWRVFFDPRVKLFLRNGTIIRIQPVQRCDYLALPHECVTRWLWKAVGCCHVQLTKALHYLLDGKLVAPIALHFSNLQSDNKANYGGKLSEVEFQFLHDPRIVL